MTGWRTGEVGKTRTNHSELVLQSNYHRYAIDSGLGISGHEQQKRMHRPPSLPTSSTFPLAYPFKTMVLIFVSPRTEHHNAMKQMGEDVCGGVRSEREANKRNMFLQHASYT
jgi:hypothetical protein